MNNLILALIGSFILVVGGCKQEVQLEELRTVGWYIEHMSERDAELQKCLSSTVERAGTYNCVNASRATNPSAWVQTGVGSSPVGPVVVHDLVK